MTDTPSEPQTPTQTPAAETPPADQPKPRDYYRDAPRDEYVKACAAIGFYRTRTR